MFYESVQEVYALELLAGHPGIPKHLGSCIDVPARFCNVVVERAGVTLQGTEDLKKIAELRGEGETVSRAIKLARSSISLLEHIAETHGLRMEDLHFGEDFTTGNNEMFVRLFRFRVAPLISRCSPPRSFPASSVIAAAGAVTTALPRLSSNFSSLPR